MKELKKQSINVNSILKINTNCMANGNNMVLLHSSVEESGTIMNLLNY